jgi:hypothetical protein
MLLTNGNYYSQKASLEYLSVSQYKSFRSCEAAAMAEIKGEWTRPKTTALLVGSYVDSWFEGTLAEFQAENPEIFKKDGSLKADYVQAEDIIKRVQSDPLFMEYMAGEKQKIYTAELFGAKWKIKIDSLLPDKIVDLKVMRSMERIMGKSFVEHWGYDLQMAVYAAVFKAVTGLDLETYLAVVTKQTPSDLEIIHIPKWRREELLVEVERNIPRILAIKAGLSQPERCGVCEYCRATKRLIEPLDFDLVGLSNAERKAIFGEV